MTRPVNLKTVARLKEIGERLERTTNALYECMDNEEKTFFKMNFIAYMNLKNEYEKIAKCGYINTEIMNYAKKLELI